MTTGLAITLGVLAVEILLLILCRFELKQPVDPLRPRMIPYGGIMLFLALGILVTLAHVISLKTGVQLLPKNKLMR